MSAERTDRGQRPVPAASRSDNTRSAEIENWCIELADGCRLRPLEQTDAEELHALIEANRAHLARWLPWAAEQTEADTHAFLERARKQLAEGDGLQLAILQHARIVGVVGFSPVSRDDRCANIGYWLVRSAQGRGIMSRAVGALVERAFATWRLRRVEIRAGVENARSRAVAERLGFTQETVVQRAERIADRWVDQVVYSLSRAAPSLSARCEAADSDLARAGCRDAAVEIVDYDPSWPSSYEVERERLAPLLAGAQLHHFGSTAVPGLAAKPVIDMIALVEKLDAPVGALVAEAGYSYPEAFNAMLSHRRFLCYPSAAERTHHLHLVDERRQLDLRLRFRDRLRADPALAEEYARLKRALAARHRHDREAYTEAKAVFVRRWSKA